MRASLLYVCLCACTHRVEITSPLKVEPIKATIAKDSPYLNCWIDDPPEPPAELTLNYSEEDIVRRVFIHKLEYNDAIIWMHAAKSWMADLKACLEDMDD